MVYWTLAYWTLNCFRKLAAESNVSAFGLLCHIRQVILPCKRNDWITVARQGLGIRSSLPSPTYYHRITHLDVCILLHYVTSSSVVRRWWRRTWWVPHRLAVRISFDICAISTAVRISFDICAISARHCCNLLE